MPASPRRFPPPWSGHDADVLQCPLLTQSGHERLRIAAVQNWALSPIPPVANPCCNCIVMRGVVLCLWVRQCDDAVSFKELLLQLHGRLQRARSRLTVYGGSVFL